MVGLFLRSWLERLYKVMAEAFPSDFTLPSYLGHQGITVTVLYSGPAHFYPHSPSAHSPLVPQIAKFYFKQNGLPKNVT